MLNNIKYLRLLAASLALFVSFSALAFPARASDSIVRAVLFFSPTCGHCEIVIQQHLPPIEQKYQDSLKIVRIDVTQPQGQQLYQNAIAKYNVPDNRLGVPALFVGDELLVGSQEIPAQFPLLIEQGLAQGGVNWPDIPGLSAVTGEAQAPAAEPQPGNGSVFGSMLAKFQRDVAGNTLAVVVLFGMIISLVVVAYRYVIGAIMRPWPAWVIPTLTLLGMFVAVYLTFIETTKSEAFCGPIGDCNSVQQSSYASLFGFLPVGVLGLLGYLVILILWLVQRFGDPQWRRMAWQGIWALSIFGVLFSIYLTFLEPFVIGATCIWCITSAVVMTLLMWAASSQVSMATEPGEEPQPA